MKLPTRNFAHWAPCSLGKDATEMTHTHTHKTLWNKGWLTHTNIHTNISKRFQKSGRSLFYWTSWPFHALMESYGSLLALTHLLITAMVILPDASRFWDPSPTVSPMDSPQSSAIRLMEKVWSSYCHLNNVCLYQRSATCNHANNKVYMCKRLYVHVSKVSTT